MQLANLFVVWDTDPIKVEWPGAVDRNMPSDAMANAGR